MAEAAEGFGGRRQALRISIGCPDPGSPAAPPPGPPLLLVLPPHRLKEDPDRKKPLYCHHRRRYSSPSSSPSLTHILPPPSRPPHGPPSHLTLRSPAALGPVRCSSDGCGPDLATETHPCPSPPLPTLLWSSLRRQYCCGTWWGSSGCAMAPGWSFPFLRHGGSGPAGGG